VIVARGELHAKFVWATPTALGRLGLARVLRTHPCSPAPPTPSGSSGLCHTFGGGFAPLEASLRRVAGVSRLYWCNSPRLLAVRPRFGVVWCAKCRPPRWKTLKMGCYGRSGLRFGQNCVGHGVLFAHKPSILSA